MKKSLILLSILVCCSFIVLGSGNTLAANPTKIKVGILLPLTGTFAAVAETQRDGALLAIDVVNKKGGLKMPWGNVTVEGVVYDDEAKLDVGVRRYRYMVGEGVKGVGGHPLKGTCQEKKIIHQQEIAFFSWERGGCENGPPSGSSEQPPTL